MSDRLYERRLSVCPVCFAGLDELHAPDCAYTGMFRRTGAPSSPPRRERFKSLRLLANFAGDACLYFPRATALFVLVVGVLVGAVLITVALAVRAVGHALGVL